MIEFVDEPYVPKKNIGDRSRKPISDHKIPPANYDWQKRARMIDPVPRGQYFLPGYVSQQIGLATSTIRSYLAFGFIPAPLFKTRRGFALFTPNQLRSMIRYADRVKSGGASWSMARNELLASWRDGAPL